MAYLRFILRYPWLVLAVAATATSLSILPILHLKVDNSAETWLLEGDPGLDAYAEYRKEFGNDEYIIIGYEAPEGVLSAPSLERIERVTRAIEQVDGVLKVTSIANIQEIRSDGETLRVGRLVDPPLSTAERQRILDKLASDPLYAGALTSRDGKAGAILVKLAALKRGEFEPRRRLLRALHGIVQHEGGMFYLTGGAMFDSALYQAMLRDQKILTPLMMLVFLVVLGLLFRSVSGVLLPTITVAVSVAWTFALIELTGHTLNVVQSMLPVVLLAIGVADSVHFIAEYQEELTEGRGKEEAIRKTTATVFLPCLFTSVTTALGFLGMLVIHVSPLREFGFFAATGTMLAFVATFSIVPSALRLLPASSLSLHAPSMQRGSGPTLVRLFAFVSKHHRWTLAASAALTVIGLAGLAGIRTSANWYDYLKPTHPTRVATDFVENRIGGVYSLEFLIRPSAKARHVEAIKNVAALREMETIQKSLQRDPLVQRTISPADFVKSMNRAMHEDNQASYRIPESRDAVGQLLLMYEMDAPNGDLYDFVNFDFSRGRITARARMSDAANDRKLIANARNIARSTMSVETIPTGLMVLYSDVENHMLTGMVRGFCIAFLAVSSMMILLLRSFRHGLLAMIPAALPVLFVVGMTGWLGIALGTMSAMMGNVALGIAVDNAIHLLTRYQRLRKAGSAPREAIGHSVTVVGRPVLYTTTVLCLGFCVLGFSEMVPGQLFGLLTATILFGSLVGSLVTLPATVLVVDERSRLRALPEIAIDRAAEQRDP